MSPSSTLSTAYAQLDLDITATSRRTVTIEAPATGEPLHDLPVSSEDDVDEAFARARIAQLGWARASFAHRRAVLLRAHDLILERREQLLNIVQLETGKTRGQAFEEVFQAASATRYNALAAARVLRGHRRRSGVPLVISTRVRYRAKGVVGVITPWNYPLSLAAMDVVPALAAGCGVVQKADDQAALSILALRRAYIDAGVPSALWAVVSGTGEVIGDAVTDRADYICFTGSTKVGIDVAEKAARRLVGVSLELGGKNPLIVLDDADPAKAATDAVYACFSALGQLCVSTERIYVHERIADAFTTELAARIGSLRLGGDLEYGPDFGTLVGAGQLRRVQRHLDDALAKGATVLTGGRARPDLGPWFFEPTVLTGVTSDMDCYAEETFGAIVTLHRVDSEHEAILAANDSHYGLNASVLSGSSKRAMIVAKALEAGSVNINEGYRASFSSIAAPMGGVKHSGIGRRNGPEGLLRFVESVTISRATGVLQLPRLGREFPTLVAPMTLLLKVLRLIRRR